MQSIDAVILLLLLSLFALLLQFVICRRQQPQRPSRLWLLRRTAGQWPKVSLHRFRNLRYDATDRWVHALKRQYFLNGLQSDLVAINASNENITFGGTGTNGALANYARAHGHTHWDFLLNEPTELQAGDGVSY